MDKPSTTYATVVNGVIKPEISLDGWEGKRVLVRIEDAGGDAVSSGSDHHDQVFQLVFGHNLAPISANPPGKIQEQIRHIRTRIQQEAGVHLPTVRISVRNDIDPDTYTIYCAGTQIGQAKAWADRMMILVNDPMEKVQLAQFQGHRGNDPIFNLPCVWSMPISQLRASHLGLKCINAEMAIAAHLEELFLRNIGKVLTLDQTEDMLRHCPPFVEELVKEMIPAKITLRQFHAYLQAILAKRKSVTDLSIILQTARQHQGLSYEELAIICATKLADF